ncbi:MAG: tetraacyldisaccharide 4'-kinase [Pseudomonadota bacterium]
MPRASDSSETAEHPNPANLTGLQHYWYRITPLHLILLPLSMIFGILTALRRALYRSGVLEKIRLPVPIIVVGNITVGGSGKTPLTLWLAQQLLDSGRRPGIISRGYGGSARTIQAVLSGSDPEIVGDEPVLMAQRRLCPVWTGRNRPAVAAALLRAHPECDVILSDDGLQHYRLQRDVEIVVVDGARGYGNGFLLPAGPLREPPARLNEVDAVIVNGANFSADFYRGCAQAHSMQLSGSVFHQLLNPAISAPASHFQGRRLHAIAGIGYPQRFFAHLRQLGLIVQPHPFADHHRYTLADLDYPDADAILMTEKDAVKCARLYNDGNRAAEKFWVLRVDAQLDPSITPFILERIAHHGRQTA